ncbi:hypothetical protein C8R44DRAFT_983308 [Mycena epipterygia]|nr:hypothetical protein C8R44DRAFT_983308 [Mycena epipterygia]
MESTPDNVFGVVLIAVVLSAILYGVGIVQFWLYIRKYHSTDPLLIKFVVIAVLLCDTCQQVLSTHYVYRVSISSMTDPSILTGAVNTAVIQLYFGGTVGTLVQQFFCWRIYKLGKSTILPALASFTSWVSFVLLYFTVSKYGEASQLAELVLEARSINAQLKNLIIITNTLSAAVDVMISVVLAILLQSSKTGFKQSTDLINRLMVFTFAIGLPTSIFALLTAISIGAFPQTQLSVSFYILLGRLYTNSLFVTLNSREYIRSGSENGSGDQYSLQTSRYHRSQQRGPSNNSMTFRVSPNAIPSDFENSKTDH